MHEHGFHGVAGARPVHLGVGDHVGRLLEDFVLQGGVAVDFVKWREDDGIGRSVRNGLNFTERGFGVRGEAVVRAALERVPVPKAG
jgi:hypothetical protein